MKGGEDGKGAMLEHSCCIALLAFQLHRLQTQEHLVVLICLQMAEAVTADSCKLSTGKDRGMPRVALSGDIWSLIARFPWTLPAYADVALLVISARSSMCLLRQD